MVQFSMLDILGQKSEICQDNETPPPPPSFKPPVGKSNIGTSDFETVRKRETQFKLPDPMIFWLLFTTLVELLCTKRLAVRSVPIT